MTEGDIITLRGKTPRGEERIRRGGDEWRIVHRLRPRILRDAILVVSRTEGALEMFWLDMEGDPHMEIVRAPA